LKWLPDSAPLQCSGWLNVKVFMLLYILKRFPLLLWLFVGSSLPVFLRELRFSAVLYRWFSFHLTLFPSGIARRFVTPWLASAARYMWSRHKKSVKLDSFPLLTVFGVTLSIQEISQVHAII
jgi:hypothetical protein